MKLEINLNKPYEEARLVMIDEDDQDVIGPSLTGGVNEVEIDEDLYQFIYFEIDEIRTDKIILSVNMAKLDIAYNRALRRPIVNISTERKRQGFGTVDTLIFTNEKYLPFRLDGRKVVHQYKSPGFDPKAPIHLFICFDGQNIYDLKHVGKYTDKHDPYRGWQIEVPITKHGDNFLVFGIDNSDFMRESELTPAGGLDIFKEGIITDPNEIILKGHLDEIGDFIKNHLIAYAKHKYNITDISIVGSSCGGLASHYLGIRDLGLYDNIFSFSSISGFLKDEFWVSLYKKTFNEDAKYPNFFFFNGASDELEERLLKYNDIFDDILIKCGFPEDNIWKYIEPTLAHNEIAWRYAFNYYFNVAYPTYDDEEESNNNLDAILEEAQKDTIEAKAEQEKQKELENELIKEKAKEENVILADEDDAE